MEILSSALREFWNRGPAGLNHLWEAFDSIGGGLAFYPLGEVAQNPPGVVPLKMPPNFVLPRHSHTCYRFEVIVAGTLDVGIGRMLGIGDVMTSAPDFSYGPHVAGPDGCTTFEVFGDMRAAYTGVLRTPEGIFQFDSSTPAGFKVYRAAQAKFNMSDLAARNMNDGHAPGPRDQHFRSPETAEFWENCPDDLRPVQAAIRNQGGDLAVFPMGKRADNPPTAIVIRLPAGATRAVPATTGHSLEVIVSGSLKIDGQTRGVGDVITRTPGDPGATVMAGIQGARTATIFGAHTTAREALNPLPH